MKLLRQLLSLTILFAFAIAAQKLYAQVPHPYRSSPDAPQTNLKCNEFTFDATKSQFPQSSNITFLWDFGDGTTSADPVVTHTYHRSGDYSVNLSVTDNSGFQCSTAMTSRIVHVNIPPYASFISEDSACINEAITFDANTSYAEVEKDLTYAWNFGDGETRQGASVTSKTYRRGGDYKVFLTVNDQSGTSCNTHTAEKMIHINEPPVANAGDDVILHCADNPGNMTIDFDASATTDVNHDPLSYIWDFGDGYKDKGAKVSHRYAQSGNYDVRLIASDNTAPACGVDVDFVTVRISNPPKADAGEDIVACLDEDISFDGSRSYVEKTGTAVAQWSFGDGTSKNGLYATHRYSRPGTYQAALSLENKLNDLCPISRDTRTVTINAPPTVQIRVTGSECVREEVLFDASSAVDPDGDDLDYYWNFGDGTTYRGKAKASHLYSQGGNYRVSVVVDDKKGSSCSTATAQTNIRINTPPIANAGPNLSCCTDTEALFSAKASSDPDGGLLIYTWDFGDGNKAQTDTIKHAYTHPGSYSVFLTVDDRSGTSCSQSIDGFVATVKEVPVPMIDIR